ncbi:hypothetical protein MGYG_06710 [Nannizzia gypsea CBS 118893]|uniref:Aminoglycoside phosphotransferase domain-containing protein n=1 Tax=Arthroderma gypseum (strain ATCC MYA-4604 / CBS 118893) TaxID=535722 RepID=E4V0Z8_ARTGP|nr:hypothetical protein MGYG_06710 [Nannizzia gypsea CBS 118893]EFR03713.1 hypothetical protein MGYG_06710 [Nannizzia gypsea CBS 118893]
MQGSFSYTVATKGDEDQKIVQFRVSHSPLNVDTIQRAQEVHGAVVPLAQYHGELGDGPTAPLKVYAMEKLPGVTYIDMVLDHLRDSSPPMPKLQTIQDLSRYFTSAWLHPEHVTQAKRQESQEHVSRKLSILSSVLPQRFHTLISSLQADLPQLYSPAYPQVLTYGDLCEMNILVMPETGRISGIVDWAEASILPFGTELWGLENMLGSMGSQGWKHDENRGKLEEEFWRLFWGTIDVEEREGLKGRLGRTVRVARGIGILLRHGFTWDEGVHERPISAADTNSLRYLDAFLLST